MLCFVMLFISVRITLVTTFKIKKWVFKKLDSPIQNLYFVQLFCVFIKARVKNQLSLENNIKISLFFVKKGSLH